MTTGMEYGFRCTAQVWVFKLVASSTTVVTGTANVVASGTNIFAEVLENSRHYRYNQAGGCLGRIDNMIAYT